MKNTYLLFPHLWRLTSNTQGYMYTVPSFFKFIYLFLAVLGLQCCIQPFSSCGHQGLLCTCYVQASHCSGFSCGTQA